MNHTLPPFSCTYTPQIPELLTQLNISLAITTYQAHKLVFISPNGNDSLMTLARNFSKPMGIAISENTMAVACDNHILVLENSKELANNYPKKQGIYDSLFLPRITYHTGFVDIHDIAFGTDGLWAVNTSFSCLCQVTGHYNFLPKWKPKFISEFEGDDRCHLNGLALVDGYPRYVTALGQGNTPFGWKDNITSGGILIDLKKDEIIFDQLAMPHSPRMHENKLYGLLSAKGQFVEFDISKKEIQVIKELDGFCRGLDIIGDYAFIGMSKLRESSSTFGKLDFVDNAKFAGIKVIHIPTKAMIGEIKYETSLEEIYEIKVVPDTLRPNILSTIDPTHNYSLSIPGKTFWADQNHEIFNKSKNTAS